jgi:hypothetical protein
MTENNLETSSKITEYGFKTSSKITENIHEISKITK